MAGLRIVQAVRISRVEERHAGIQRGMKYLDATRVITVAVGREAHAPDTDGFHVCVMHNAQCKMQNGVVINGRIVIVCILNFACRIT
jgi:hypothetical protein